MAKCAFLYFNLLSGLTATGSSTAAGLGVDRLNDAQPSVRCRFNASAGNINFRWDAGSNLFFDSAGLISTDILSGDTIRFRASKTDAAVTSALECDVSLTGLGAAGTNGNVIFSLSTVLARYMRFDITLASGTTRDIGLAPVGLLFRPAYNFQFGGQEGRVDLSKNTQNADTGARFGVQGPSFRTRIITLPALTKTETRSSLAGIDRFVGAAGDLLFIEDPDASAADLARDSIWGSFREIGGNDMATRTAPKTFARSFKLTERI